MSVADLVFPSNSHLTYWGMDGHIKYNDGYSVGLLAGREFGRLRLYGSWDYTSFTAKEAVISTPYGLQTQSMNDLYHSHTFLANFDYRLNKVFGVTPIIGAGIGATIDDTTTATYQVKVGVEKKVLGGLLDVGYVFRANDGQLVYKHKTISEPDMSMIQVSWNWRF